MIQIPENNCVNCKHFAWWDGDFCCIAKNKILQESPDGEFNKDILMALLLNKNCSEHIKSDDNIYQEDFNDFIKTL